MKKARNRVTSMWPGSGKNKTKAKADTEKETTGNENTDPTATADASSGNTSEPESSRMSDGGDITEKASDSPTLSSSESSGPPPAVLSRLQPFGQAVPSRIPFAMRDREPGSYLRYRIRWNRTGGSVNGSITYALVGRNGNYDWIEKRIRYRNREKMYRFLVREDGEVVQAFVSSGTGQTAESVPVPDAKTTRVLRAASNSSRTVKAAGTKYETVAGTFNVNGTEKTRFRARLSQDLSFPVTGSKYGIVRMNRGRYTVVLEEIGTDASAQMKLPK